MAQTDGSGRNAQNQHGDVVRPATLERHGHQLVASVRGGIGLYDAGEFRVADHAPEPVGTKEKDVPLFERERVLWNVRGNVPTGAQGGGKNMALGVRLGIFGAHDATLD